MSDPRADAARYRAEREMSEAERGQDARGAGPRWATQEERWAAVETAIQIAIRRGEFDDLPGAGRPLEGLGSSDDPDWWIKRKIEREGLSGIAPPAIQLRNEHRAMEETLDAFSQESDVRAHLEEFNRRVRRARMQLEGGPPVVTPTRDVEAEVVAWRERRRLRAQPAPGSSEGQASGTRRGETGAPTARGASARMIVRAAGSGTMVT